MAKKCIIGFLSSIVNDLENALYQLSIADIYGVW